MALNWGGAGMGALTGAGTGAGLGSFGGPIGTGIGGGIGGLIGLLSGLFSGDQSPEKFGQQSSFSPQNQQQFDQLISQLLQGFSNNQFDFYPVEQQARSNFAEQTIPGIAERFTSMGGGGGRSSAFGQQLGAAGAGLERDLAAQKQGFNMQQQGLNQNLLRLGSQQPFYQPRTPGGFESALPQVLQGLGSAAGGFLSGPAGGQLFNSAAKRWGL